MQKSSIASVFGGGGQTSLSYCKVLALNLIMQSTMSIRI